MLHHHTRSVRGVLHTTSETFQGKLNATKKITINIPYVGSLCINMYLPYLVEQKLALYWTGTQYYMSTD